MTCCLIHVFVHLSLQNTGFLQCVKCAMATLARAVNPRSKRNQVFVSASKALMLSVYCRINPVAPVMWHDIGRSLSVAALCSASTLTGAERNTRSRVPFRLLLLWRMKCVRACARAKCEEREIRGQGGRRGELHKTALLCREREGGGSSESTKIRVLPNLYKNSLLY